MAIAGPRVVSLVPSMTETLLEWGITPIACTRFCEQPSLTHVGGTKDPDVAAIVALAPDVVLMDREENRREDAEALTAAGIDVHATHITDYDDVATELQHVRTRLALPPMPAPGDLPPARFVPSRTAFVAIWRRPWMTCNGATYGSSLLRSIGVDNVFADAGTRYPEVTLAEVAARRPELVLLPSEPYPFAARHVPEINESLPDASVRCIDGQDLFWWGARSAAARHRLLQVLGAGA
jgi:ABC-type Fe3+-hydroxamate transport system substrate-binding protein